MAVGKLTVGKILATKLGYRLTHNHLINDLVWSVFKRNTLESNKMVEKLRYEFYETAAKFGHNLVITHCYAHDYVSPTFLSDPQYLKTLEKHLRKAGAKVLFVHLQAERKTLLKRVRDTSRREHQKLTDTSIMKDYLKSKDFKTSAPVENNLVIDNTSLSPERVVEMIIRHLRK